MPKGLFFTIDNEKKSRIIEAATREFSCKMYDKASINQIIKVIIPVEKCTLSDNSEHPFPIDESRCFRSPVQPL